MDIQLTSLTCETGTKIGDNPSYNAVVQIAFKMNKAFAKKLQNKNITKKDLIKLLNQTK